ncbi:Protein of unknown function [Gryllus bimaculatus]|nr:Protein of unknown function [Gryllus bimaculatus]
MYSCFAAKLEKCSCPQHATKAKQKRPLLGCIAGCRTDVDSRRRRLQIPPPRTRCSHSSARAAGGRRRSLRGADSPLLKQTATCY